MQATKQDRSVNVETDGFKWGDPGAAPPRKGNYGTRQLFVKLLKAHPGRWARFRAFKNKNTAQVTCCEMESQWPGVEAVWRGIDVYCRWTGPQEEIDLS